MHGQHNLKLDP